jgi:hypothetical protein
LSKQSCSRRAMSVQSMKLWLANFAFLCFSSLFYSAQRSFARNGAVYPKFQ